MLNNLTNFYSIIRGRMLRNSTTVEKTDIIPLGVVNPNYDGGYAPSAITVADLAAQIAPQPTYKVYTALLTQSGGDAGGNLTSGDLTIGVTYKINSGNNDGDFTNVGAPNNNPGTYFVATGTTPNTWGTYGDLKYNSGAPVATVLENTIGDIWFTYHGVGYYDINKDSNFEQNKTFVILTNNLSGNVGIIGQNMALGFECYGDNVIQLTTAVDNAYENGVLFNTPIEIRVYN